MIAAAAAVSCTGNRAEIKLTLAGAPSEQVVVKAQNLNRYEVLDTLYTDDKGKLAYKVDVRKGDPEFFFLYRNDRRFASLLLEAGDKVRVEVDADGHLSMSGSEDSRLLAELNEEQKKVDAALSDIQNRLDENNLQDLKVEFNKVYIDHYRSSVAFVMKHCKSLVSVPALYEQLQGNALPVFGRHTDALVFKSVSDSLNKVWPESRYAQALAVEAQRRVNEMQLSMKLSEAEARPFPELVLKDRDLKDIKLSEVEAECIMLHFWNPAEPAQKMFNVDVLFPLYKEFHKKGLEIYAVALTSDRVGWGLTVGDQNLPWINVCDPSMNAAVLYNLQQLPTTFFINRDEENQLVRAGEQFDGVESIRKYLRKVLK